MSAMAQKTANFLPPLTDEEYELLKLDIEAYGILHAIEICSKCGVLLDGHHRLRISEELGIPCPSRKVDLPTCSPEAHWAWAWRCNLGRRQLDPAAQKAYREQRKEKARILRLEQHLTQAQVAALVGVSREAIKKWEQEWSAAPTSDGTGTNASKPDLRRKLTEADIEEILRRLAASETQQAIADDLESKIQISQQRIAQIAAENRHRIVPLPYAVQGVEVRCADARERRPSDLADLAFFSPPYNVGKDYDGDPTLDSLPDDEWQQLLREVMEVLRDGWKVGRIVVNVPAALDRTPYQPVVLPTVDGLTLEAIIVWDKGTTGNRTSWGSWRLPTEPRVRDRTERLYVYRTPHSLRIPDNALIEDDGRKVSEWLSASIFTTLTQDLWAIPPESSREINHPAPFPVKLAENVIRLYGWKGCMVIDPFAGSGTTGIAAAQLGCRAVLIDRSEAYCRLALKRLMDRWGA